MEKRVMIVTHVPVDEGDAMRDAIGTAGGGKLVNIATAALLSGALGDHCLLWTRIQQLAHPDCLRL